MQQDQNPLSQNEHPEKKGSGREKVPSHKYSTLEWVLVLLLLVVLGVMIWNQRQTATLKQMLDAHSQQISEVKAEGLDIKTQLQAQQAHLVKTGNQSPVEYKIVQTQQPQDLIYLIHLAQQYLTLQKNVDLGLKSLRLARGQMAQLKDEAMQSLGQEMDKEIQQLAAIEMPREDRLMEQLNHLALEVEGLSVMQGLSQSHLQQVDSAKPVATYWERFKQSLMTLLRKAVVVRHEPSAGSADAFVPNQPYLTGQIQLWLLKAQWAVFQHQGKIYQESLDRAIALLKRYFVQDEKTKAIQTSLEKLKAVLIDPELPDLSHLLERVMSTQGVASLPVEKKPEQNSNKEMPVSQEQRVLSS